MIQHFTTAFKWILRCVAAFVLGVLVWVYWSELSYGKYPSGHPWCGLTFLTMAACCWLSSYWYTYPPSASPGKPVNSRYAIVRLGIIIMILAAMQLAFAILSRIALCADRLDARMMLGCGVWHG